MNAIPTPVFVALVVAGTGVAVFVIPGSVIGAAVYVGRLVRNTRAARSTR